MPWGRSYDLLPADEKSPIQTSELPAPAMQTDVGQADTEARRRLRHKRHGRFLVSFGFIAFLWYMLHGQHKIDPAHTGRVESKFPGGASPSILAEASLYSEEVFTRCTYAGAVATREADGGSYVARRRFDLPLSPFALDTHFFEILGGYGAQGSVTVTEEDCVDDDMPFMYGVDMTVKHQSLEVLNCMDMCSASVIGHDLHGVMLSPTGSVTELEDSAEPVEVHLKIRVPTCIPAFASRLKMNLPGLAHVFEPVSAKFNSIEILSHDATIENKGIRAEDFQVVTKNSPITGFFNVTNSLRLITSNAPINVTVEARHAKPHWPTDVRLYTSNAALDAKVSLFNTTEHSRFRVVTKTSNGPADIEFLTTPFNATLHVDTVTSNAPARLTIDAAFEGVYVASSSNAAPEVEVREDVDDPTGQGRKRSIETNYKAPHVVVGAVYWGGPKREHRPNSVSVKTSNKAATIIL